MKLLVTGGAGFIGSNFIHYILDKYPDYNLENLKAVEKNPHYTFVKGDIGDYDLVDKIVKDHQIDMIVNFAAESHNSWAIIDPGKFFKTNVLGTQTLLEIARRKGVDRFQHVSTCEVYGDLPLDSGEMFTEQSPCRPQTPYNASKAGADHAVQAYHLTFNVPTIISRCSNNYGPF